MGDIRECCLCAETYNDNINKPKVLGCGHSLCEICLVRILGSSHPCPICQREIIEPLSKIPTNYALIPEVSAPKPSVVNKPPHNIKYNPQGDPVQWDGHSNIVKRRFPAPTPVDRALIEERKQMQNFANSKVKELSEFDSSLEKSTENLKKWCGFANDVNLKSRNQIVEKIQRAKKTLDDFEQWCTNITQQCISYNINIVNQSLHNIDAKRKEVQYCLSILQNVLRGSNVDRNALNEQLNQVSTNEIPEANVEFYTNVYEESWNCTVNTPQNKVEKFNLKQLETMSTTPQGVENYEWHTIDIKTGDRRQERYIEEQIELGYRNREPKRKIINKVGIVIATVDYANKTFILKKSKKLLTLQRILV